MSEASLNTPPATDPVAILAQCQTRIVEREGIPMFIALQDLRPGAAARHTQSGENEGERLSSLFDYYHDALRKGSETLESEEDPTGASKLIEILVVLSDRHLRADEEPQS